MRGPRTTRARVCTAVAAAAPAEAERLQRQHDHVLRAMLADRKARLNETLCSEARQEARNTYAWQHDSIVNTVR